MSKWQWQGQFCLIDGRAAVAAGQLALEERQERARLADTQRQLAAEQAELAALQEARRRLEAEQAAAVEEERNREWADTRKERARARAARAKAKRAADEAAALAHAQ